MDIKDSVALVTGGGRGIGAAICKYFVQQGAKVAVVDVSQEHVDHVAKELKALAGEAMGAAANVSNEW